MLTLLLVKSVTSSPHILSHIVNYHITVIVLIESWNTSKEKYLYFLKDFFFCNGMLEPIFLWITRNNGYAILYAISRTLIRSWDYSEWTKFDTSTSLRFLPYEQQWNLNQAIFPMSSICRRNDNAIALLNYSQLWKVLCWKKLNVLRTTDEKHISIFLFVKYVSFERMMFNGTKYPSSNHKSLK